MTESEILSRIASKAGVSSRLVHGIGDDCAVYRPEAGEDLVYTTDFLIEDIHFRHDTHTPSDIGRKCLARGLSDIAAMGATPLFCLLSLALPSWAGKRFVNAFYSGFLAQARLHSTLLAGGDLAHAPLVICDVVVCGSVPRGRALLRSGAKAGDAIYVSGKLGRAAVSGYTAAIKPRLALGRYLRGIASAAMDLSDGLSQDLTRLAIASGVSAVLDSPVPAALNATEPQALHGGEDYELLFTAPPATTLPPIHEGVPITRIGTMIKRTKHPILYRGQPLVAAGYDHFRK